MNKKNKKNGFSLVELMAVIAIIGIIATIVTLNVVPFLTQAHEEKIKADFSQIGKALELFYINEKKYPSTQQGLQALLRAPETLRKPHLYPKDGYIKEIPIDPWGNPYLYLSPGQKTVSYDLFTYGADGIEGGDEENLDLGNWAFEQN